MTGAHKSGSIESLVAETRYLAQGGARELLVIAQDLSYYGIDIYGGSRLSELITRLSEVEGIEWIRLHYLYPSKFPVDVLKVVRENPKVCRYIDMPLQHISNSVLKRMRRHVAGEETRALVRRIKDEVPGVALRTTMMTGYPGETEEDFCQLKDFISEVRFDKLGVFTYSHEEGTYAWRKFNDDVPEEVKQARADELMALQQEISAGLLQEKTGQELKVIIDRKEGEFYIGRSEYDSPEVDGEVFVTSEKDLDPGSFQIVRITKADDYDLYGEIVVGL